MIDYSRLAGLYMHQLGVKPGETIMLDSRATGLELAKAIAEWLSSYGAKSIIVDHSKPELMEMIQSGDSHEEMQAKLANVFYTVDRRFVIFDPFQPNPDGFDGKAAQSWATNVFVPLQKAANDAGKPWLVISPPSEDFAAAVGMEHDAFFEYYLNACCVDYSAMATAAEPLRDLLVQGKQVRITSDDHTDIRFEIVNYAVICHGERNFPDGECFTAPVRESVNGKVKFGPSKQQGIEFPWIQLTFENGKVTNAVSATDALTKKLNQILDTDEGARYVGEFAMGFNPNITHPVGNALFDEKIAGSFHFALGRCYPTAPNENKSGLHWDLVQVQTPEHGGGEIWIDGALIRKNGLFVLDSLKGLNPDRLLPKKAPPPHPPTP